jgi:hypothetical protein
LLYPDPLASNQTQAKADVSPLLPKSASLEQKESLMLRLFSIAFLISVMTGLYPTFAQAPTPAPAEAARPARSKRVSETRKFQ